MATILMAWELGEGLGHVQHLLRVGRALAAEGHTPVFALANVVEPWPLFQHDPFVVIQAPYWNYYRWRESRPFIASSFADVLAIRGWDRVESLLPLVTAWQNLVDSVRPALIVAEYAPTACLAARGSVPVVQVGGWFSMPPVHGKSFPLLVSGQAPVLPQEELLSVVQQVQRQRQRPVLTTLPEVLAGDRFVLTVPEFDSYSAERREPVWDQLEPCAPPATSPVDHSFFAYLTAHNPQVEAILTQLALTGYPGTAYLRSAPADLKDRLRLVGLTVLDRPEPLVEVLTRFAVLVHHGGITTTCMAFAAGRPQLLFPQHLEQTSTAQRVARLGVGLFLLSTASPEAAGRSLRQLLTERRFADTAALWAQRLSERPARPPLPAILECCHHHLNRSRPVSAT